MASAEDTSPAEDQADTGPSAPPPLASGRQGVRLKREALLSKLFPSQVERPTLGRYEVIEFVGEGGMGTVYAAHDPRLDRRVAIKSLRKTSDGPQRRARLLREAKVLARLNHPNIVTVHEVWEEQGNIYIAMEFVEGQDLAQWQRKSQPWREVLEIYRQAGEGLAGAHDAGLVYRDFKPANAIRRDGDGVVKLLDFGLARLEARGPTQPVHPLGYDGASNTTEDSPRSALQTEPTSDVLTHRGAIVGTPAYMAPEQFDGIPADARSDQFSFAVSLWEALFGTRPFMREWSILGGTLEEREIEPPRDHGVPAWVRRVVERGLAHDPFERYPSMRDLLRDLGRDPAVRRRRVLGAVAMVFTTVAGGLAVAEIRAEPPTSCVQLDTAWGDEQRHAAKEGVFAAAGPFAEQTWELLEPRLERHANERSDVRLEACETHRRGLLPEEHYALQTACLDRGEAGFIELVELLGRGDASAVENANKVIAQLPSASACTNIDALLADHPPPEDPEVAARVTELRNELARAGTEESAGLYTEAADRAGVVLHEAEALGYDPLRAEALVRRGSARMQARHDDAMTDLDDAVWLGLATEQRRVAAEAAAKRIFVRADPQGQAADVTEAIALARSLADRAGAADWRIRWALSNNIGIAFDIRGEPDDALTAFDQALAQVPDHDDAGRFERATTMMNMALIQQRMGRPDEAIRSLRRAIEDTTAVLGSQHPEVIVTRASLARTHRIAGHYAEARTILTDILERSTAGKSMPFEPLFEAVEVARQQGDVDAARAWIDQAKPSLNAESSSMWLKAFSAMDADIAAAHGDATVFDALDAQGIDIGPLRRADILLTLGRAPQAEAILTPIVNDSEGSTRYSEFGAFQLGRALVAQRRWADAHRRLTELVESDGFADRLGLLERSRALQALSAAEAGLSRPDRAMALADQALELLDGFDRTSQPVRKALAFKAQLLAPAEPPPLEPPPLKPTAPAPR